MASLDGSPVSFGGGLMVSKVEMERTDYGQSNGSARADRKRDPATILVVDDDLMARELMTELLEVRGYEVIAIERGEEVFDWIGRVDIILLDAMLPGRDGWSICRELKERHDPLLPVIMVTARATPDDMVRTFDAHADDYVTKPFHSIELVARIETRLRVHRMEQELREMGRRHAELAEQNFQLYQKAAADAEEREILLRELDHRVRNNLSVIMGLASLERSRRPERPSAVALGTLENRFRAFLLVYESLRHSHYRSVPVREIAERMLQRLRNITATNGQIRVEVSGQAADLGERQAFSLALILNELIANALEHAFPEGRPGMVRLHMADQEGEVLVELRDDGIGFSPEVVPECVGSGHSIVNALIHGDLAGRIDYTSGPDGTTVTLSFPRDDAGWIQEDLWGEYISP
jgi:DNA-binding response OmpR family regulator